MKKTQVRRKTDYGVGQKEFIAAWQTSDSPQECAERLGMPKAIVIARAASYRDAGVPLKMMRRRPRNAIDVEALTKFLKELEEGTAPVEGEPPVEAAEEIRDLLGGRD